MCYVQEIPRFLLHAADGFLIVYSVDDEKSYLVAQVIMNWFFKNNKVVFFNVECVLKTQVSSFHELYVKFPVPTYTDVSL